MITKEDLDAAVRAYTQIVERAVRENIPVERFLIVLQIQGTFRSLDYIADQVHEVDRTLQNMAPT